MDADGRVSTTFEIRAGVYQAEEEGQSGSSHEEKKEKKRTARFEIDLRVTKFQRAVVKEDIMERMLK